VELRNMLLEERKGASQYKSMFDATPAAMEIDKVKNEAHGNKTDKDSALDDDNYVEVLSAEAANAAAAGSADGPKTKATATGAAAAAAEPALTFKLVPEYKEVAAGPTSVKVRVRNIQPFYRECAVLCLHELHSSYQQLLLPAILQVTAFLAAIAAIPLGFVNPLPTIETWRCRRWQCDYVSLHQLKLQLA
jgi:hypothetical protein